MSSVNETTATAALDAAAKKYSVPATILFGIFGKETSFGANVNTSSTGAMGPMQFEPATAAQYGYPMTNTPTTAQLGQQMDAAASYLSALYKKSGNWNTAIEQYSGGGYGLPQVQAQAKNFTSGGAQIGSGPLPQAASSAANAVAAVASSVPNAISDAVQTAVGDAKYAGVLVGVLVLGVLLIYRAFSGGGAKTTRLVMAP